MIANFCRRLVTEMGFDGVHLDPEPIPSGDEDTLLLLDEVRAAIGPGKILSLATREIIPVWNDAPLPPAWGLWQAGYYRRIAGRVDEIAAMTYDSTMRSPWLYEQWLRFQVIGITRAVQGVHGSLAVRRADLGRRDVDTSPTGREHALWVARHHRRAERCGCRDRISGWCGDLPALGNGCRRMGRVRQVVVRQVKYPYLQSQGGEVDEGHFWDSQRPHTQSSAG